MMYDHLTSVIFWYGWYRHLSVFSFFRPPLPSVTPSHPAGWMRLEDGQMALFKFLGINHSILYTYRLSVFCRGSNTNSRICYRLVSERYTRTLTSQNPLNQTSWLGHDIIVGLTVCTVLYIRIRGATQHQNTCASYSIPAYAYSHTHAVILKGYRYH